MGVFHGMFTLNDYPRLREYFRLRKTSLHEMHWIFKKYFTKNIFMIPVERTFYDLAMTRRNRKCEQVKKVQKAQNDVNICALHW